MSMTFEELKRQLSAIEPTAGTYAGIGSAEVPLLERLLESDEAWMASRAVFSLGRIGDAQALAVLARAARDPRPEVRVSLAASVTNLSPTDATDVLVELLDDSDAGVRKFAIKSVTSAHEAAVHAKLRELSARDPVTRIRDVANHRLRELSLGP